MTADEIQLAKDMDKARREAIADFYPTISKVANDTAKAGYATKIKAVGASKIERYKAFLKTILITLYKKVEADLMRQACTSDAKKRPELVSNIYPAVTSDDELKSIELDYTGIVEADKKLTADEIQLAKDMDKARREAIADFYPTISKVANDTAKAGYATKIKAVGASKIERYKAFLKTILITLYKKVEADLMRQACTACCETPDNTLELLGLELNVTGGHIIGTNDSTKKFAGLASRETRGQTRNVSTKLKLEPRILGKDAFVKNDDLDLKLKLDGNYAGNYFGEDRENDTLLADWSAGFILALTSFQYAQPELYYSYGGFYNDYDKPDKRFFSGNSLNLHTPGLAVKTDAGWIQNRLYLEYNGGSSTISKESLGLNKDFSDTFHAAKVGDEISFDFNKEFSPWAPKLTLSADSTIQGYHHVPHQETINGKVTPHEPSKETVNPWSAGGALEWDKYAQVSYQHRHEIFGGWLKEDNAHTFGIGTKTIGHLRYEGTVYEGSQLFLNQLSWTEPWLEIFTVAGQFIKDGKADGYMAGGYIEIDLIQAYKKITGKEDANPKKADTISDVEEEETGAKAFDAKEFAKKQCEEKASTTDKANCKKECGEKKTKVEVESCVIKEYTINIDDES